MKKRYKKKKTTFGRKQFFSEAEESLQIEKAQTCVSYHIQAYQRQSMQGEMADITEACKHCLYNQDCDFAWSAYILSAIPFAKYQFTLAEGSAYQQRDTIL